MSFRCERFRSKAVEFNQINDLFVADTHLAQIEVSEVASQNPHVTSNFLQLHLPLAERDYSCGAVLMQSTAETAFCLAI